MVKMGLTGGLGTGKSTVARLLEAREIPVLDTDDLAREFTQRGRPVMREIVARFGPDIVDDHGDLRRDVLAARVFADPGERQKLEAVLHPPIRQAWKEQLGDWQAAGRRAGCVVIPLLYETACEGEFDVVLCTACGAKSQRERLRERGWSDEQIDHRLAAQLPLKIKMQRAGYVIWTEGAMASTEEQLDDVLDELELTKARSGTEKSNFDAA